LGFVGIAAEFLHQPANEKTSDGQGNQSKDGKPVGNKEQCAGVGHNHDGFPENDLEGADDGVLYLGDIIGNYRQDISLFAGVEIPDMQP